MTAHQSNWPTMLADQNRTSSIPSFSEFIPFGYQCDVIEDIYSNLDWSLGTHEILLSGSVGSAKSILMAHLAARHAIENYNAEIMFGRKALPDLKDTLYSMFLEHLGQDIPHHPIRNIASVIFPNGSKVLSRSWSDKKYKKMRSLALSMACFEELTENNDEDKQAYIETTMRVGRRPHIEHRLIISASNPDDPSHWAYDYFIAPNIGAKHPTRHVYYSLTEENPYLDKSYVAQLLRDMDPKMALRMLKGQWIELRGQVVYYGYDVAINFRKRPYSPMPKLPIHIMFDFNIGEGKPMSCAVAQHWKSVDEWHIFDEIIIEGARTSDIMEELDHRGYLKKDHKIIINGDAAGKHRDTRSSRSDYDIIMQELRRREVTFEYRVPPSNPAVRARHNTMNAYFKNAEGKSRLFVYEKCKMVNDGFRLTKLKKGADYIEDDSKAYQHVTTAIGYGVMFEKLARDSKPQGVTQL